MSLFELTKAEHHILLLTARGASLAEIATARKVTRGTVKKQAQWIRAKTGARSVAHAAIIVLERALELEASDP